MQTHVTLVVEAVQTQLGKKAKICSIWKVQTKQFVPCGLALISVQNMAGARVTRGALYGLRE